MISLLGLRAEERAYLAGRFARAGERAAITVEFQAFLEERQLITARLHDSSVETPRHCHNYMEMMYVYRGSVTHRINGTEVVLRKGDLLLMNQYIAHSEKRGGAEDIGVIFVIRPEFFDIPMQMIQGKNEIWDFLVNSFRTNDPKPQHLLFRGGGKKQIQNLLENLIETVSCRSGDGNMISQYTAGLIFLYLLDASDSVIGSCCHGHRDLIIRGTLEYIDSHYSTVTLGQIAEHFRQPLSRMSKIIKEETGQTFRELLLGKRFQKASQLLLETDLRVEEIAAHVGYENISYFYRQFKKRCGMTPRQYRCSTGACRENEDKRRMT